MGYVTIGLFSFREEGINGAIIQMLSHGLVSAALFLCIGVLYDRTHTRIITDYGGLVQNMPKFALVFMVFMLASIGVPGTSGFVGELLVLIAAYKISGYLAFGTGLGMILGAAYMLWLYKRVVFGTLDKTNIKEINDLDKREIVIFIPIILGIFWLGIFPDSFSLEFKESVISLIKSINYRISI
jgi:NADH-quinone oxidoreductase subunit M